MRRLSTRTPITPTRFENEYNYGDFKGEPLKLLATYDELASGDLRALYLAWLVANIGAVEEDAIEPPVPPGLQPLSPAVKTFVELMGIDRDLVAVAAKRSRTAPDSELSISELVRWVAFLPEAEKDSALLRLLAGEERHLRAELLRALREAHLGNSPMMAAGSRSVAEIVAASKLHGEERKRQETKRAAAERARRQAEEAKAREAYLDGLAGQEEQLWRRIETLIEIRRGPEYDQAAQYLKDLRDLSNRSNSLAAFESRVAQLARRHPGKKAFLERLQKAGMVGT